jgi:hypothetical protein
MTLSYDIIIDGQLYTSFFALNNAIYEYAQTVASARDNNQTQIILLSNDGITPDKRSVYVETMIDYPMPDMFDCNGIFLDDPDLESSENTMIDHSGYGDLFIERLIHNNNS